MEEKVHGGNRMKKSAAVILPFLLLAGCGQNESAGDGEQASQTEETIGEESGTVEDNQDGQEENSEPAEGESSEAEAITPEDSQKEEYLLKLEEFENELADLEAQSKDGTQTEMNQAQAELFKKWDTMLNEIYGVLEEQLPTDEMEQLREKQREWIEKRDAAAEAVAKKYEGGTLEALEYGAVKTRLTKERCYQLVEMYM
jgi:uncharacterized protein YecT (DUF1311 family)